MPSFFLPPPSTAIAWQRDGFTEEGQLIGLPAFQLCEHQVRTAGDQAAHRPAFHRRC